jgi:dTDP-4-dehydrorhamnose reductase
MRYVIAGRAGMLGAEVRRVFEERGWTELRHPDEALPGQFPMWSDPFTNQREPDFATDAFVDFVRAAKPDLVVNAAGIVGSHKCHVAGSELCHRSNVSGARRLAEAARDAGAVLVHFTSDVEFDPDSYGAMRGIDPTRQPLGPRTRYGRTKLRGRVEVAATMPPDRLLVVYPSFGFGGYADSKSVLSALLRSARGVRGYPSRVFFQLSLETRKELTWHRDVGRQLVGLLERGRTGTFSSTSCDPRPYGEYVELIRALPGAPRRFDLEVRADLDYKGDSFFDAEFAGASWEAAGLHPTPLEEALQVEWEELDSDDPGILPHTWTGLEESLSEAAEATRR